MKEELSKYVGGRIRHFRKIKRLTQKELGSLIGVKHNTISSYENGTNEPEHDTLFSLANALNISINDLFPSTQTTHTSTSSYGEKGFLIAEPNTVYSTRTESEYNFYPVSVAAGQPSIIEGVANGDERKITIPDSLMGKHARNKNISVMKVNGDSMNKILPSGTTIAIKRIEVGELKNNDIVVFSNSHEYSVKRFYDDVDNKRLIFSSESTDRRFADLIVKYEDTDNLTIHGKVVVYIVELD